MWQEHFWSCQFSPGKEQYLSLTTWGLTTTERSAALCWEAGRVQLGLWCPDNPNSNIGQKTSEPPFLSYQDGASSLWRWTFCFDSGLWNVLPPPELWQISSTSTLLRYLSQEMTQKAQTRPIGTMVGKEAVYRDQIQTVSICPLRSSQSIPFLQHCWWPLWGCCQSGLITEPLPPNTTNDEELYKNWGTFSFGLKLRRWEIVTFLSLLVTTISYILYR